MTGRFNQSFFLVHLLKGKQKAMKLNNKLETGSIQKKTHEKGVTIVEYVIMLAIVAIAVALASPSIKNSVLAVFERSSSVMLQTY